MFITNVNIWHQIYLKNRPTFGGGGWCVKTKWITEVISHFPTYMESQIFSWAWIFGAYKMRKHTGATAWGSFPLVSWLAEHVLTESIIINSNYFIEKILSLPTFGLVFYWLIDTHKKSSQNNDKPFLIVTNRFSLKVF